LNLSRLIALGVMKKYHRNEIILNQTECSQRIVLILAGNARVCRRFNSHIYEEEKIIAPGDFFDRDLLSGKDISETFLQSIEETVVLLIARKDFLELVKEDPVLAERLEKNRSSSNQGEISLFPPGHKTYPGEASLTDEQYLFPKQVICPVCGDNFSTLEIRSSRLKLERVEQDFRQLFANFEPLWYSIRVCPHCYYANFSSQFDQVSELEKKIVSTHSPAIRSKLSFAFSVPRQLSEVFTAYYLALYWQQKASNDQGSIGNLWLRLSWLYRDVGDQEMYALTSANALKFLEENYYSRDSGSIQQDQRVCLLLGQLYLEQGRQREALGYFQKAVVHRGGNHNLNQQAQDRIQELRRMRTATVE
jgi:uncharacterized protein (DUF2225 family)